MYLSYFLVKSHVTVPVYVFVNLSLLLGQTIK